MTPPLPLLLTPLATPVALTFGVLLLRTLDDFLRVERGAAGSGALLAGARLRDDEHHRHIDDDARAFAQNCRQHERDPDKRHVDAEI
jgi:hypothetical protein